MLGCCGWATLETMKNLQNRLEERVTYAWHRFVENYPSLARRNKPSIKTNKRLKTTGGRAWLEHGFIDISLDMCIEHGQEFINFVVDHEVGHFAAWYVFNDDGHGPAWKQVMRSIGASDSRCHYFANSKWENRK